MKNLIVQVSLDDFLEKFVPGNDPTAEERARFVRYDKNVFDVAAETPKMYTEFCKATLSALQARSDQRGDLIASDTGSHTDSADKANRYRPDVSIFPTFDAAKKAYTLEPKDTRATSERAYLARTSWSYVLIPVEVKAGADGSAFLWDDQGGFLRDGDGGLEALGQLVHYAFLTFRYQHRTSLFMVVTCRHRARIIRWDRSSAVVTRPFEFAGDSNALLNFFYKFSKLSDAQRGLDTSAVLATKDEEDTLKQSQHLIPEAQRDLFKEITEHGRPIYKITIPASDIIPPARLRPTKPTSKQSEGSAPPTGSSAAPVADPVASVAETQQARTFFIGKPRFTSDSTTGRSTRGYVAYDMLTHRLVFLKDTWRSENARAEHEVYVHLWKCGVQHIATPLSGGDVRDDAIQKTRSQECDPRLQGRVHYRLIVLEVGKPLKEYEEEFSMVMFIEQALQAHRDAWTKANVAHCDVSSENIMIDVDPANAKLDKKGNKIPCAFLNDWDLCKFRDELGSGPTQTTRSGTWQFMSGALLRYPSKQHELSDDLESFIYVIYWLALRFHDHDRTQAQLENYIHYTFDQRWNENGRDIGGDAKMTLMASGLPPCELSDDPVFDQLLKSLAIMCQKHYRAATPMLNTLKAEERRRNKQNVEKVQEKEDSTLADIDLFPDSSDIGGAVASYPEEPLPAYDPFVKHEDLIGLLRQKLKTKGWKKGKTADKFVSFKYYCRSQHQGSTTSKRGSEAADAPTKTKRSRVSDSH
ncbi:hypothetical protein WOLCODRAFT_146288 [Wolfiporia cocos MD-104 SS10]|uniref:Fungal-type protein kinase domain-containing protein n=1 Tax=Wolfiporia cocos (strain MD-104) TaxID=742152 RepID=A0A2H3J3E0_WOLCO|nr:hypothetical protein WOLCODRAFT_146288 [Wolfiporia cocos MD-104 SS10]